MNKLNFLQNEFPKLLRNLKPESKGNWGVLSAQGMIEHMIDAFSQATGKNNQKLLSPVDQVEKYKAFAMSDKEFKPNTKNALMSETPAATKLSSINEAIILLEQEINNFINYFDLNKGERLMNPFFGDLNFEEWTQLLYKHAVHHCKQFGLI